MRIHDTVILWLISMVVMVAIINGLRWLGIETEVFDFIGRIAVGILVVKIVGYIATKQ